jgi:hypothetical protein
VQVRRSLVVTAVWSAVIAGLVTLEIAELTHLFTLPLESALSNPIAFVFSLVFTTIVAIIGATFVGIYISHRLLRPAGFTPFEEEMLRMRIELQELARSVEEIRRSTAGPAPPGRPRGGAPP